MRRKVPACEPSSMEGKWARPDECEQSRSSSLMWGMTAALCTIASYGHAAQTPESADVARFPQKAFRIMVPFAPGGGTDFIARLIAVKLTESWGQPVVVDNRGGASATIGTEIVAKAPADGYTFGIVNAEHTIVPSIFRKVPYHPLKDFTPITQTVTQSYILVVHPTVPAKSVQELIAVIKSKAGRVNYGSAQWSVGHLAGELFKLRTGTDMTNVPYKGTGPAIIDLLGGQLSLMFSTAPPAVPHIKDGRLRAIAITAAKRSQLMPEVPTVSESGVPGFEATGWNGFLAPAKTPKGIVDKLNAEIVRILALPDMRERLAHAGVEPVANRPDEFGAYIAREIGLWAKVVKDANLRGVE